MTKLLEQGIEAVKDLPDDRQDFAGEVLLWLAGQADSEYELTSEQLEDLKLSIEQADRAEFATNEEVAAMWKKLGL